MNNKFDFFNDFDKKTENNKTVNNYIYTQEDLDQNSKESYEKGKQEGINYAINEMKASEQDKISKQLEILVGSFDTLISNQTKVNLEIQHLILEIIQNFLHKLFPIISEQSYSNELIKFLEKTLVATINEPKIIIKANQSVNNNVKPLIEDYVKDIDFSGKLAWNPDDNLTMSDIIVEWDGGGVEFSLKKILSEVDNIVASYKSSLLSENSVNSITNDKIEGS